MDWKRYPLLRPLVVMLFSRKFLVMLLAALMASGLDIPAEWQAVIFLVAGTVYAALTAAEDIGKSGRPVTEGELLARWEQAGSG